MDEAAKPKGMCIATRCTSIDQFVEMFHRFVDEDSFFVSTTNTRPPGLETSFSVNLADGTPVLRGTCVVLQAWPTTASPFKTPGVRLGIKRLTASSIPVFERLLVTRTPTPPPPPAKHDKPPTPVVSTSPVVAATPKTDETRTPGSDYILPANPLTNLTDESLEGFVDCTLYEETANYFPTADDGRELDPLIAPPKPAAAAAAAPPEAPEFVPLPVVKAAPPPPPPEPPAVRDEVVGPSVIIETQAEDEPSPAPIPPPMPPPVSEPAPLAFTSRDSAPAGELAVAAPRPTKPRRRWPVLALAGGALAAATVLSLQALGGSEPKPVARQPEVSAPTEPPAPVVVEAPAPAPVPAADVEPAPDVTAEVPSEHDEDVDASVPAEGGAPIVGDGPCRIAVASTPAGSIVYLDGAELAPSPITIATTCGKHKVDIKHPRYKLLTKVVTPADGAPAKVEVTLQRPTHAVQFTSQPSGATVFIDGRRAGTTPTSVSILGFSNLKIEVKKTGYKPLSTRLYSKVARDKFSARLSRW